MEGPASTQERPSLDETTVVANLHINHDKIVKGEMSVSEKLLSETREDLSRLECYPIFKDYVSGNVPTLVVLARSAARAVENIERLLAQDKEKGLNDEELAGETKIKNLLAGRGDSIKRNVNSYIQTIIRFHNLKRLAHGGRDATEQFVKADESRRRSHENLLQSLSIFTATIKQATEEGLLEKENVIEWVQGMPAQSLYEKPNTIVVFSPITLKDRDYIKDWAIAADFDSQLQDMFNLLEENAKASGK